MIHDWPSRRKHIKKKSYPYSLLRFFTAACTIAGICCWHALNRLLVEAVDGKYLSFKVGDDADRFRAGVGDLDGRNKWIWIS